MENFERIKRVIEYLHQNHRSQPGLNDISSHLGISAYHLHRLFSDWAGVTPKTFLKCLTLEHAKSLLKDNFSVLDATLETGLSGPGRLHDLCVSIEAASPGEIKSGGTGLEIQAGFTESPFGFCLIGLSQRGICHLSFEKSLDREFGKETILQEWPNANLNWCDEAATSLVNNIFVPANERKTKSNLRAFVKGTDFQVRVWRALLRLPAGYLSSYGNIAGHIGMPGGSRAVGSAVGKNPIAFLIPCHRVIQSTGAFGDYRWGAERKQAIIAWESAQLNENRNNRYGSCH